MLEGGSGRFVGDSRKITLPSNWIEEERVAAGTATSYRAPDLPADGRFQLAPDTTADYRTRILIRRPDTGAPFNGTVVVEWLNVSGGVDGAPEFGLMADELTRGGYAWVGVSAQMIGVEGGSVAVPVRAAGSVAGKGLKGIDPARYGTLRHPGDAFAYDIFTQVGRAARAGAGLGDLRPDRVVAVGESQSAAMLVTYANGVQPLTRGFDAIIVHSRGGPAAPLGAPGEALNVASAFAGSAVKIRDDVGVPVLVLQTETDVALLGSVNARQDDNDHFRLWEIAGSAHADRTVLGVAADSLDCGGPVNDGPQRYIVRAALRSVDRWVRDGTPPPQAPRLQVDGASSGVRRDADGIALGGIRTPLVDAPVAVLTGQPRPGSSIACLLSGATDPLPTDRLVQRYGTRAAYLDEFTRATDAVVSAGFVLADDRDSLLATAQPDMLPG